MEVRALRTWRLLWSITVLLVASSCALADGMLIPGPPTSIIPDEPYFTVKYHHVTTEINDQVANTYVDQVFVNDGRREMEATYIFPLPKGAVVQKFTLHADGKELQAELMDKDKAQRIYEDIVRRRKDPALLTYAGEGLYQAKIYPIPAGGERRIEIRYTELLHYDTGLVGYLYPLSPEKFSNRPIESVAWVCDIHAAQPVGSVYSPSHDIAVTKKSDTHVRCSYEEKNVKPDSDILLYYNVGKDPIGLSVITFKERKDDGFFLLLAAPTVEQEQDEIVPKNICFVLDTSGSMSGEKIEQAKDALTFCVNSLNSQDRFNIIAFSDSVKTFSDKQVRASAENVKKAREFISDFDARGGTDIDSALREALKQRIGDDVNYICFLTDGEPTVGVTDNEQIVKNIATEAEKVSRTTRLFVFGVGYDVNTNLLDKLAQGNGGLTTYVRPSEDIEVKVSSFFAKIAQPLLTDVTLEYGRLDVYDAFPRELPDLFHGSQIEVMGRYKGNSAGRTNVVMTGKAGSGSQTFELGYDFPEQRAGTEYIAMLWASRKIGYLLDQIRLHGEKKELVDEVVKLSMEYGILTEYTAFLADEDGAVTADEAKDRAAEAMSTTLAAPGAAMGAGAVSRAQNAQVMQQQTGVQSVNAYVDAEGNWQRFGNIQNAAQRGFVNRSGRWEDTRYQRDQQIALRVRAYSEAHFQLSRSFPALNSQLAVGDSSLLILNGQLIEIGEDGKETLTDEDLKMLEAGKAGADQPAQGHNPVTGVLLALAGLFGLEL